MAEVIAAFDPEVPVEHDRQRKYPWDQWFDGQIWRLTPGVDFENHSLVIERQIRTRASARKVAVHIQHGPDYAYLNVRATARPEPGVEAKVHDIIEEAVEEAVALVPHEHDGHTIDVGVPTTPSPVEPEAPSTPISELAPEAVEQFSEPASSNEEAPLVAAPVEDAAPVAPLPPLPTAPETVTIEGMAIPVAPLPDAASEAVFAADETPEGDVVAVGTDEPTQDELDADTAEVVEDQQTTESTVTESQEVTSGDVASATDLLASKPIEEQTYDEQLASVESVPAPLPAPPAPAPAGPFQAPSMHPPLPHPAPLPQNPFGGLLGQ
jgi:hypothetical protein